MPVQADLELLRKSLAGVQVLLARGQSLLGICLLRLRMDALVAQLVSQFLQLPQASFEVF